MLPSRYYVCAAIGEAPTGEIGYLAYDLGTDKFYVWSDGVWNDISGGGGGAPTTAPYWVAAPNAGLSAEVDLSALSTGLIINTGGTPSSYTGASCTNQFPRSLSATGAATCASVDLANDTGSALPLAKLADDATSGLCLVSGGTGGDPTYTTCPGGSGGGNSVEVSIAVTSLGSYFSSTVSAAWVASGTEIVCRPFGTTADGLTPEAIAISGVQATVSNRVAGVSFDLSVNNPYGLEGTVRFHCLGV